MKIHLGITALSLLTACGIALASSDTAKNVDATFATLTAEAQKSLLAGVPADQIMLPGGLSLDKTLEGVLAATGPLEYVAIDPCDLAPISLIASSDVNVQVRNLCGVPASAKAATVRVEVTSVSDEFLSKAVGIPYPGLSLRPGDLALGSAQNLLPVYAQSNEVTNTRLCESCGASELKIRSGANGVAKITVLGYYVPATAGPAGPQGATGPQGPQGIQGIQGPPGASAAITLICGTSCNCNSISITTASNGLTCQASASGVAPCSATSVVGSTVFCCACRNQF
jgi:hypothetical protein